MQHERLHLIEQTRQFYECYICGKTFNQKFGKNIPMSWRRSLKYLLQDWSLTSEDSTTSQRKIFWHFESKIFPFNLFLFRGPKERWKCAICFDKILPPGNLALHYEKAHSSFASKSRLSSKDVAGSIRKGSIKNVSKPRKSANPTRRRGGPKQPKPEPNFWPCSICGNCQLVSKWSLLIKLLL